MGAVAGEVVAAAGTGTAAEVDLADDAAAEAALAGATEARDIRARTVALLANARAEAMADIVAGLATHPRKGRETVRAIAELTDATVRAVHHVATTRLHPNLAPTEGERLAVMAVGGFNGSDPSPTLEQFQQYVEDGDIHYLVAGGGMGGGMGGSGSSSQITTWVQANFTEVTIGGTTFYDLTQPVASSTTSTSTSTDGATDV